jgi:pimeloyl-ACP methyl ester carboxylesterase
MRLPSRVRALILLAVVLELPLLARFVRLLTGEPQVEHIVIDGVAVEVVKPARGGPWPTWLFVNGAHPLRRAEPVVTRLSRGLARAGYLVLVPDVPGLGDGAITARTLEATAAVTAAAIEREDVAGDRVALIGASTGAALALLTASRDDLADRISVVAAVAPFADLGRMICLATTRGYPENGVFTRYDVTDLHRRVVARSLVATISDDQERERLLGDLELAEQEDRDPLAALPDSPAGLSEDARAVLGVLKNEDPELFAEYYEVLPARVRELLERLSPVGGSTGVRAPVELVVPPSDVYFPPGEANALATVLPNVHLTITSTLDHTRPQVSLRSLRDLRAFDRFVVRGLAAAARW